MKKIFFLLMVMAFTTAYSQEVSEQGQQHLRLVFSQADFGDRFAVQAEQDDDYNYFVTDLTKFSDLTEKTIFLNLVYEDDKLISIDSDLTKDQLWFKAYADNSIQDIICKFDDLKAEAVKKAGSLTPEEKAAWSGKYGKFNGNKQ